MIQWLKDAVFYEIYPQSFYDTNGDGIGDLRGITEKLDYIKSLGCNALWLNPVFDSPFKDAGYDVRDYKKVAPRYGTNADLEELFREAHKKGIRVLLDLVPGHTSEEHPWFLESQKAEENEYSGRYVWTSCWWWGIPGRPYVGGECERNGTYMLNFFKCQPALNYGWRNPTECWQMGLNAPDCLETRAAMTDVIRFWLSRGADGFRVDMADSLIKDDDEKKSATASVWQAIFAEIAPEYPEAAFVAEWSNPSQAICGAGFHMDFYLDHGGNGYNTLLRDYETPGGDHSFFKKDAGGDINRFLKDYLPKYECSREKGYISFFTCNHDTPRPTNNLTIRELKLAYAFLFTMPGVPFLYYGDELGMKYNGALKSKEGGYTRTGSRTPMQWNKTENLGFSKVTAEQLYLPVDTAPDAVTAEGCEKDPDSLLHTIRTILKLRHEHEGLQADGGFEPLFTEAGKPFAYRRGSLLLAVNSNGTTDEIRVKAPVRSPIFLIGEVEVTPEGLRMGPQSFAIYK